MSSGGAGKRERGLPLSVVYVGSSARLHVRMIALKKSVELVDLQLRNWAKLTFSAQSYVRSLALVIAICLLCKAN